MDYSTRIDIDSEICHGKPVIKGTRLTVDFILKILSNGWTYDEICEEYDISREDILAVLSYAHSIIMDERVFHTTLS